MQNFYKTKYLFHDTYEVYDAAEIDVVLSRTEDEGLRDHYLKTHVVRHDARASWYLEKEKRDLEKYSKWLWQGAKKFRSNYERDKV